MGAAGLRFQPPHRSRTPPACTMMRRRRSFHTSHAWLHARCDAAAAGLLLLHCRPRATRDGSSIVKQIGATENGKHNIQLDTPHFTSRRTHCCSRLLGHPSIATQIWATCWLISGANPSEEEGVTTGSELCEVRAGQMLHPPFGALCSRQ